MKVSVVIPAYNEEEYIESTLRHLLAQTFKDREIIVVDNASTDKTSEIVKRFPEVILLHEDRKGVAWTREAGRKIAKGEIVAQCDADCMPDPEWLEKGLKYFDDPNVAGLTGTCDYPDFWPAVRLVVLSAQITLYWFMNELLQLPGIRSGALFNGGNTMFRASALKDIGYDTRYTFYGEDTEAARRVSKSGKVVYAPFLFMKTSARRLENQGVINIWFKYIYNYFKVIYRAGR